MKRLFPVIFLIFIIQISFAQRDKKGRGKNDLASIKGYISGLVIDSLSNGPVEYAIVELISIKSKKQIDGVLTDEDGSFKLYDIKTGSYKIKISFIGYKDKIIYNVDLTLSKPDKKLGKIFLVASDFQLNEIQILDQRSLIESKIDRTVYNVAKDPTLEGGDATDVLRKVPMLSVDMDGNVSLRGSKKVKILLNGKPSGLFSDDVGEALQMFPADEIKKVEVMTSPGAKYDGEGSAGIINIVTKKGIIKGVKGSVKTFIGDKMEHLRGSLAIGRGRFGANARLGARYKLPKESTLSFYRKKINENGIAILKKNGRTDVSRLGVGGVVGAFYDINAYNSINTSIRLRGHNYNMDGEYDVKNESAIGQIIEISRNEIGSKLRSNFSWNGDFTRKFKSNKEKLLIFAVQLEGKYHEDNNSKGTSLNNLIENNNNFGNNRELTVQMDFTQPINKSIKIEIGAKTIFRNLNSDFKRLFTEELIGLDSIDYKNTDGFNYYQDVYSGYFSSTVRLPYKFGIIGGIRYEKTKIDGSFNSLDADFSNEYYNWLPSITISKRFSDFSNLKVSYNERIHRPSLRHINPFINNIDPFNISYGNPGLSPELTRQFEIGYSKFLKGSMINFSIYYKRTKDLISSFLRVGTKGISHTTYYNIGRSKTYGVNAFSSVKLFRVWEIRANLNLNRYIIIGTKKRNGLRNKSIRYNAFISSNISLTKGWKAEIWGFFNSPSYTLQGKNPSFSMFSIGVQKSILKNKGKVGLRLVEPFNKNKSFLTELEGETFYQRNELIVPFRSIGITFSYSFGKLKFKSRKSAIKNDDVKGGDDQEEDMK